MKKKNIIIICCLLMILILIMAFAVKNSRINKKIEQQEGHQVSEQKEIINDEIKKVDVQNYGLVTYLQNANSNSYIKNITVDIENPGDVEFVIGKIDANNYVQKKKIFTLKCQKGENSIDLEEKYIIKKGEYLFMNIEGQDFLYENANSEKNSLVQNKTNKVPGKISVEESNYILPFKYTLDEIKEYNALFIGNEITINDGKYGLAATDEEHDYYYLSCERLKNTFEKVTTNRIDAIDWEKDDKNEWIEKNLNKDNLENLDLIVFQLGDNYKVEKSLEEDIEKLILKVREFSPNVEIVWIYGWNQNKTIINVLPTILQRLDVEAIDISDLNTIDYQTLVENRIFENNTVKTEKKYFPNNEAMQTIANRITEVLEFDTY